jgi:thioredoxin-like negative regulator of GroEL
VEVKCEEGARDLEAAMDGLLEVLQEDGRYRDGAARIAPAALLELPGERDPLTRPYRTGLDSVLLLSGSGNYSG